MKVQPLARQSSLIVKEVDDETLIYDLESDQAHCLNNTAAQVWKNCDGRTTVDGIAHRLGKTSNTTVDENVVWLALDQLEKFKLLETQAAAPVFAVAGMSRRQAVRALGAAAIALPLITSIVAPTAAQSGSVLLCGCNNPNDCVAFPGACCTPHNACTTFPSTKGCIISPPPCK